MNFNYTFPKRKLNNESVISKMNIIFKNGDFLVLSGREIMDISIRFYDNLIFFNDGWSPVAESGFIKLKINSKGEKYESPFLYNRNEYYKGRISYIKNRLVNEGGISFIRLFNENNYSDSIFGDIYATIEDDFVFLHFKSNDLYGPFESDRHTVSIGNVARKDIRKIGISLENCDSFDIYEDDIVDIQLNFDEELDWNSGNFIRRVSGGYIKLLLDKSITYRDVNVYSRKRRSQVSLIEDRLCEKSKESIDICHLYIHYYHLGYGMNLEECIEIPTIDYESTSRDFDYNPYICQWHDNDDYYYDDDDDDDDDYYDEPSYISGYAERQKDGSILIVFGKEK